MLARDSPIELDVPFVANQPIIVNFKAKKINGIGNGINVKVGVNYLVNYKKGHIYVADSGIQYINVGDIEKDYILKFVSPDGKDIYSNKNIKILKNVIYIALDSGSLNAEVDIGKLSTGVGKDINCDKDNISNNNINDIELNNLMTKMPVLPSPNDPIQIVLERMRKNLMVNAGINKDIITRLREKKERLIKNESKNGLGIDIVCEGLMLGHSGFGKATRNYAYGLDKLGFNVRTIILDRDNIQSTTTPIGQRLLQMSKNLSGGSGGDLATGKDCFWITMNYPLGIKRHDFSYNIAYIMFETLEFPNNFVNHLRINGVNEIWTPSTFCKDSMEKAGLREGIIEGGVRVMPLGVDTQMFNPEGSKDISTIVNWNSVSGKFKFLSVMGFSARKGVNVLVRAFSEEFAGKDSDKVALYLKGGWYPLGKAWADVNAARSGIGGSLPLVHLDFAAYPESILANLYRVCNAFVLPSIGEGWCMPCCEAMATGLPTIATRWGGMLEFMNDDVGYLIDVDRVGTEPTCDWITKEYIGRKFAKASVSHLRKIMRHVYENREEANEIGLKAREWMVKNYSWDVSCKRMKDRLEEITMS